MNRSTFIGATFFLGGILLLGFVHLAIANFEPNLMGYSTPPGKFEQIKEEIMIGFPYFLSWLLMIVGSILLFLPTVIKLVKRMGD